MKFEFAPREQLLFVKKLEYIFLDKIVKCPRAFVSDESCISHFESRDIEESIGKSSKPGYYLFKFRTWKRKNKDGTINLYPPERDEDWIEMILELKAIHYRKWIIRKCKRFFGVNITE